MLGTLFFYFVLSCLFLLAYFSQKNRLSSGIMIFCIIIIIATLFITTVNHSSAGDAGRYMASLRSISTIPFNKLSFLINLQSNQTWFFTIFFWFIGSISTSPWVFFIFIFAAFIRVFLIAIKEEFHSTDAYALIFCYALYPTFFSYLCSGIRQGIGMSFMLCGIVKWSKNKKLAALILLSTSMLWHYGMLGPFLILAPFLLFRDISKLYVPAVIIFVLAFLFYTFGNSLTNIIGPHIDNYYAIYFNEQTGGSWLNTSYQSGIRLSFLVFSLLPVFVYFLLKNHIKKECVSKCKFFISIYMLLNTIYLTMSSMVYSDRVASFSWFIMPLVVYELCISTNFNNIRKHFLAMWLLLDFILLIYFNRIFLF